MVQIKVQFRPPVEIQKLKREIDMFVISGLIRPVIFEIDGQNEYGTMMVCHVTRLLFASRTVQQRLDTIAIK